MPAAAGPSGRETTLRADRPRWNAGRRCDPAGGGVHLDSLSKVTELCQARTDAMLDGAVAALHGGEHVHPASVAGGEPRHQWCEARLIRGRALLLATDRGHKHAPISPSATRSSSGSNRCPSEVGPRIVALREEDCPARITATRLTSMRLLNRQIPTGDCRTGRWLRSAWLAN
jgi:hypothetical protein